MPTLILKMAAAPEPQRDASIAQALTTLTAEVLGKRPEVTAVIIEAVPIPRWYIGAHPVQHPTAWLEISITAGTNSAAQKALFIEGAHALLKRRLSQASDGREPAYEPASYVIVRELPESDWGYGGQTQQARRLARERVAAAAPA